MGQSIKSIIKRLLSPLGINKLDLLLAGFVAFCTQIVALWIFNTKPNVLHQVGLNTSGDGNLFELAIRSFSKQDFASIFSSGLINTQLAWPSELHLAYYPTNDYLHLLLPNLIATFLSTDLMVAVNIYILLKFGLLGLSTYLAFRFISLGILPSFFGSVLFTFLPFNFYRAEGHLALAQNWIFPIVAVFILKLLIDVNYKPKKLFSFVIGILAAIIGTYYTVFTLLLVLFLLLVNITRIVINNFLTLREKFVKLKDFLIPIVLLGLGVFISLTVIQYGQIGYVTRFPPLIRITDGRLAFESILYSGDAFTFLFPFFEYILLGLNKDGIVNSLYQFILGEGNGAGLIGVSALLFAIFLVALLLLSYLKSLNLVGAKHDRRFIFREREFDQVAGLSLGAMYPILISIALFIYLFAWYQKGGFGIIFSSLVSPEIRAWGRLSIVLGFLAIVIFLLTIQLVINILLKNGRRQVTIKVLIFSTVILITTITTFQISEIKKFNYSRPNSQTIIKEFNNFNKDTETILNSLEKVYGKNCALVYAPHYYFPEFDRPDDELQDYYYLEIPLADKQSRFKWSIGGVKHSPDDRWFGNLMSDTPPFAFASLSTHAVYASQLGACGVIFDDKSYSPESIELDSAVLSESCDFINVYRPNSDSSFKLEIKTIDLRSSSCRESVASTPDINFDIPNIKMDNTLLWRFIGLGPNSYIGNRPIFEITRNITMDLMNSDSSLQSSLPAPINLSFEVFLKGKRINPNDLNANFCLTSNEDSTCFPSTTYDSKVEFLIPTSSDVNTKFNVVERYNFTITEIDSRFELSDLSFSIYPKLVMND